MRTGLCEHITPVLREMPSNNSANFTQVNYFVARKFCFQTFYAFHNRRTTNSTNIGNKAVRIEISYDSSTLSNFLLSTRVLD